MKHAFKNKKMCLLIFIRLNMAAFYFNSPTFHVNDGDLALYLNALIFKIKNPTFHVSLLYCVQCKLARLMLTHP